MAKTYPRSILENFCSHPGILDCTNRLFQLSYESELHPALIKSNLFSTSPLGNKLSLKDTQSLLYLSYPEINPDFPSEADVEFDESGGTINRPGAEPAKVEKKDSFFDKLFSGRLFQKEEAAKPLPQAPVEIPTQEDVEFDERGGIPEVIGTPPVQLEPIMQLEIGDVVKKNPNFSYGYRLERIAPNGQRQYSGTGAIEGKTITPAMQEEAEAAYLKQLEAANKAQEEGK